MPPNTLNAYLRVATTGTRGQTVYITANDGQMPTGCWAVSTAADGSHYILYESYIPNNASAELVQNEVTFVGKTADALEAELTGGQDVQ